jgi:hypothetical protein
MGIGMGALDPDRKYVVLFEIYGPASKPTGDAFDKDLKALMTKYGGLIKHTWHAKADAVDPELPKPSGKKSGKKSTKTSGANPTKKTGTKRSSTA